MGLIRKGESLGDLKKRNSRKKDQAAEDIQNQSHQKNEQRIKKKKKRKKTQTRINRGRLFDN